MRIRSCYYFILILLVAIGCKPKEKPADLIILGTIYTVNEQQPKVEAVAVSGDKIVFAGKKTDVESLKGENTQVIELKDRVMIPGFIEGHAHVIEVGYNEMNLNLMDAKSYDEIVERVKEAVAKAKPGQWILGRGWHQDKWEKKPEKLIKGFQTHQKLSEVSPNNPVFLEHASGHLAIANGRAMELAGVNMLSKERQKNIGSEGGEVLRDELGNPTGIFSENAMSLIYQHIPKKDEALDEQALNLAFDACLRNGITSVVDAGVGRSSLNLFYKLKEQGKLRVRMYVMLSGAERDLIYEWYKKGPDIDTTHWLTVRSIKLYTDGALGSRGAWLLEPYTDRPDFSGMATLSMDTVLKSARDGLKYGFQVCSHAIGDRANREILDRYEQAFKENPDQAKDVRFRIEHAQHLHPDDIARFGRLGVIPAMQAIHMSSDRPWAIDRLGEKRIKEGAYMWQSLLKSGAHVVNGTDAPVEPINPIPSLYASVTRKTLKGQPEEGYEPEEKMTRAQALKSYTLDAAYGSFEENTKGSIEKGKLADFTILSQDIIEVPEDQLLKTEVLMTIVGGKVVYQK
ncbi:amidohydrolase [Chryseosolibacter indicus]|uniref:Amidohydrolase n=1 Tax=Chryseosolibacter indicus TaxID=2782351 RepID=A0ABS5VUK7_9BACT|nr:amidohydrolase [Chryseosolibacter indicus]MBT1704723.1 amidohydrolase [Chryseosolibacter indicus]